MPSSRRGPGGRCLGREGDGGPAGRRRRRGPLAFAEAVAPAPCGRTLEGLAEALHLVEDYGCDSRDAYEQACTRPAAAERDAIGAYRAARMIAFHHGAVLDDWALFHGWLQRASTLLEEAGGERQRGRLELRRQVSTATATTPRRRRTSRRRSPSAASREILTLEFQALAYLGAHLVAGDRAEEGMPMLDEALAAVCAGELTDTTIADEILCFLLGA